jgi:hypothetical protein
MVKVFTPDLITGTDEWDQWHYVAGSFGVELASELPSDCVTVRVQPEHGRYVQGAQSLCDFEHPEDCVYVFGSDVGFVKDDDCDYSVFIPSHTAWTLFASQAGAVVLYDRLLKHG